MNSYGIIRTFGVVVLLATALVQCSKIHDRMTDDETADVLPTNRDQTLKSEMAPVRNNRYKRSDQHLQRQLSNHGKTIDAYLNPSDSQLLGADTPVWLAFAKSDGTVEYKKLQKGIVGKVVSTFYPRHFTSNLDSHLNEEEEEEDDEEDFEDERTRRNSEDPNATRTMLDTKYNVTINTKPVTEEEKIRRLESLIREGSRFGNRIDASRVKRSNQGIVYPSLLVQTDFKGSMMTLDDIDYYEEIIYQVAFWNAVDLRFRDFDNPKIRIRITGIVIGLNRGATPYLQNGDEAKIWDETRIYWWKMGQRADFPHQAYHMVVTMTENDVFNTKNTIPGFRSRYFCTQPRNEKLHTVAIVRDNGGFEGILKATRALGNLLGLDYDYDSGDECDNSKGFMMQSKFEIGPNNLKWSPCNLKHLSWFLSLKFMQCYNTPAEFHPPGRPIPRVLPGDVLDPEKQCQGRGYHWSCESIDTCTQMQCYYTHWKAFNHEWWCNNTGPAAEGTKCAPGHSCVNGVCQCMTEECLFIH